MLIGLEDFLVNSSRLKSQKLLTSQLIHGHAIFQPNELCCFNNALFERGFSISSPLLDFGLFPHSTRLECMCSECPSSLPFDLGSGIDCAFLKNQLFDRRNVSTYICRCLLNLSKYMKILSEFQKTIITISELHCSVKSAFQNIQGYTQPIFELFDQNWIFWT